MPDRTFLDWPFFDEAHRDLAQSIEAWSVREVQHHDENDVDAACKDLVRKLASGGWLDYAAPDGHLNVRSLCLIRETLARHSGLADFAFAMQGLGSAPIGLFGGEDLRAEYLPAVRSGTKTAAFALSEPDAGSDVGALTTTAKKEQTE